MKPGFSLFTLVVVAVIMYSCGESDGEGEPKGHNSVPPNRVMEIHAVSHLGLPDTAYVLVSPFNSNEEPEFYHLEKDVPEGAGCFMAYSNKDKLGNRIISFVTCPATVEKTNLNQHYGP